MLGFQAVITCHKAQQKRIISGSYLRSVVMFATLILLTINTANLHAGPSLASSKEATQHYNLYLDADLSNNKNSGEAIALGIKSALHEINYRVGKVSLNLIELDHRGSSPRSRHNLETILKDERALAVFGGMHSPPLIAAKDWLNEKQLLTLVPWAAATPITRSGNTDNWVFRLSVDDSKAGRIIVNDTIKDSGFKSPYLLLEDTGWGKANEITMTKALDALGVAPSGVRFFQWGIGQHEARAILENAINLGADSFILVANTPEGLRFAKAMLSLETDKQKPFRSHWGITGGDFAEQLGLSALNSLDLRFIQTNFSFLNRELSELAKQALASARNVSGNKQLHPRDIKAPTGFIHAYDLTRILIQAITEAQLSGETVADRKQLKNALESLVEPISGLIKFYTRPFAPYTSRHPDAHEALDWSDFTMGYFDQQGHIRLQH